VGVVGGPKDLAKGRSKFIEEALRDLNPALKEDVIQVLSAWQGDLSEAKLADLVGMERAKRLVQSLGVKCNVVSFAPRHQLLPDVRRGEVFSLLGTLLRGGCSNTVEAAMNTFVHEDIKYIITAMLAA